MQWGFTWRSMNGRSICLSHQVWMEEYVLGNSCHMMNLGMNTWPGGSSTSWVLLLSWQWMCCVHNFFFFFRLSFPSERDNVISLVGWRPSLTTESTRQNYHSSKLLFDSLSIFRVLKWWSRNTCKCNDLKGTLQSLMLWILFLSKAHDESWEKVVGNSLPDQPDPSLSLLW